MASAVQDFKKKRRQCNVLWVEYDGGAACDVRPVAWMDRVVESVERLYADMAEGGNHRFVVIDKDGGILPDLVAEQRPYLLWSLLCPSENDDWILQKRLDALNEEACQLICPMVMRIAVSAEQDVCR